jgi:Peptidase C26
LQPLTILSHTMGTKLGTLAYGPGLLGGLFSKLFSEVVLITRPEQVKECSAIVLWGGEDISPAFYNEDPNRFNQASKYPSKRDILEWQCLQIAHINGVPIIGVCRGAQLMCVFDDGKLAQDVTGHNCSHEVETSTTSFYAPGDHHQMMLPSTNAEVIGWSKVNQAGGTYVGDGDHVFVLEVNFKEPEIVWFPKIRGLGFQYHPEWGDEHSKCSEFTLDLVKETFK